MTQSTFVRDIKVKATTSTAVESFSGPKEELTLNVIISPRESRQEKCDKALAKTPEGGIVEISFTGTTGRSSNPIRINYLI